MPEKQFNIVFYFSDQQRFDTCGCYGQQLDITPNLDRFANEGTLFENAFTAQPVCGPCRALFQSGKLPTEIGCFVNTKRLPLTVKTLANYMEGAGYETAYVGKWHLASDGEPEKTPVSDFQKKAVPPALRGGYTGFWRVADVLEFTSNAYGGYIFDEHCNRIDFKGYRADFITDQALEFLNGYDGQKPFFLTVSHIEPHHQNDAHHYQGPKGSKEKYKNFIPPKDLENLPGGDWKEEYPDYLGACNSCDENFGRIIAKLKEKNLYEDTVIIYTSDHGSHFRTRNQDAHKCGYDDYKRSCHEAAIHVPLVISGGPFLQHGKRIKEIVSTASIPKTLVHLAGIEVGNNMIGEELDKVAQGRISPDRENEVFIQISESRVGRCVRNERYKYAVVAPGLNGLTESASDVYVDDFLYDLETDPYELTNLIGDSSYNEIKTYMRKRLLAHIKAAEHVEPELRDR